jgi:hypothetical protein
VHGLDTVQNMCHTRDMTTTRKHRLDTDPIAPRVRPLLSRAEAGLPPLTCKFCGCEIANEGGVWADVRNGDNGGTYDYCPANDNGHRKAVTA